MWGKLVRFIMLEIVINRIFSIVFWVKVVVYFGKFKLIWIWFNFFVILLKVKVNCGIGIFVKVLLIVIVGIK